MTLREKIIAVFANARGALSMGDIVRACGDYNRTSVQRVVKDLCDSGELCALGENRSRVYRLPTQKSRPLAMQLVRVSDEEARVSFPSDHASSVDRRGLVEQLTRLLRAEVELKRKIQEITDKIASG